MVLVFVGACVVVCVRCGVLGVCCDAVWTLLAAACVDARVLRGLTATDWRLGGGWLRGGVDPGCTGCKLCVCVA